MKGIKPHQVAPHVAAILVNVCVPPSAKIEAVRVALSYAVGILQTFEPTDRDLTNPDDAIAYALLIESSAPREEITAACHLLRMCHHAIERGDVLDIERTFIPNLLAACVGYVPDKQSRVARRKRASRSEADALDRGIDDALKSNTLMTWKELATWLEGEGVITSWNDEEVTFTDGKTEKTISAATFRTRITIAKNR